jgi:hypothetical protein
VTKLQEQKKLNPKCKTKKTRKEKKTPANPQTMQTKHKNWERPEWVLPFILGREPCATKNPKP